MIVASKDRVYDFVLWQENTRQRKLILPSVNLEIWFDGLFIRYSQWSAIPLLFALLFAEGVLRYFHAI